MSFLRTAGAAGFAVPYLISRSALAQPGKPGANDRLSIALIGCGGMGRANLAHAAASPTWSSPGPATSGSSGARPSAQYKSARPYADYRELLDRKDLDGVIIGTPPHWHCLMAVDACRAGKDIYLQKPMTLYLAESLAVRNAVRKHRRICQVGTQIHAGANYRRVVELVRSGNLGKISVVRTFNVMNQGPQGIGNPPNSAPPAGLDWDRWVGPCPMRPYNPLIVNDAYTNCSFMPFSGGWTPGMAPHIIDLPVWALDLGYPTVTFSSGGRYTIRDAGDAPDTQEVVWQYGDFTMTWSMSLVNSYRLRFRPRPACTAAGHVLPRRQRHDVCELRDAQGRGGGRADERTQAAGRVDSAVARPRARVARLDQDPQAAQLLPGLPLQSGRAAGVGEPVVEAGPGDPLRPAGGEDRRRRGSRPAVAARVPRPVEVSRGVRVSVGVSDSVLVTRSLSASSRARGNGAPG